MSRGRRPDTALLLIVGALVVFGLVALSSASTVISYEQYGRSSYLIQRQLLSVLIGILLFAVTFSIDYRTWRRYAFPFLLTSLVLLIAVFLPGIGRELLGARRWIDVGPIFFQPAEVVKLTFLLYLAAWLEQRTRRLHERNYGLWPFLVLLGTMTILLVSQPDVGTLAIIASTAIAVYIVAGAPLRDFGFMAVLGAAAFWLIIQSGSYRANRLLVFLNPQLDPQGIGYHINQALLAIGSGGLFGVGLGHSRQKFNYLPEVAGDSIFAVIAEELGLIVVLGLLALFVFFAIRGFRIARRAPDEFGRILAAGVTSWFIFQALINIGALTGVLPLTGVPLPFISYGGSAMIMSLGAIGILANISRHVER